MIGLGEERGEHLRLKSRCEKKSNILAQVRWRNVGPNWRKWSQVTFTHFHFEQQQDPSLRRKLFLRLTIVKCYHYDDDGGEERNKAREGGQARSHPPSVIAREQQSAQEVA